MPASKFSVEDISSIYHCRWQVELLFKELKQETNWRKFATQLVPLSSAFKAAQNVDMWFLPV